METLWKSATPNIPKPSLCSLSEAKASEKNDIPKKNNGTKLLNSADMSWFGLLHIISEELATATFMETDQNELRFPQGILNEAQTVTKAVQPQKAKHSHSAATIEI